jgi:hypothetical protein
MSVYEVIKILCMDENLEPNNVELKHIRTKKVVSKVCMLGDIHDVQNGDWFLLTVTK